MKRLARVAALLVCLSGMGPASAIDVPCWPIVYHKQDSVSGETETSLGGFVYVRHRTARYAANQILSLPQRYPREYPRQFYVLWPLSGLRRGNGHDAWVFPVLWSGHSGDGRERRFSLFPAFYYGRKGDKHTLNLCILQHNTWSPKSHGHCLFPLFWYDADRDGPRTAFGLLPLVWVSRNASSNEWHGGRREYTSSYGGALLLNWWGRYRSHGVEQSGKVTDTVSIHDGVFPVFSRADHRRTVLTGQTEEDTEDASLWIVPYWQSRSVSLASNRFSGVVTELRSDTRHGVIPLYWEWDVIRDRNQRTGHTVLPIWWRSAEYVGGELETSASFVVPIGAHFFRRGEYETYNVAGPVFTRLTNERQKYTRYDVCFPFFSWTTGESISGGRIFPLFGWDEYPGRHDNSWYLCPFVWRLESAGEPYEPPAQTALALHELGRTPWNNPCHDDPPKRYLAVLPFWWSHRKANEENVGVLPLYWRNTVRGRETHVNTVLPLLLGAHQTDSRDDVITFSRQDYLFSILAHGKGREVRLWRAFPFFSYYRDSDTRKDLSSFLLPFSFSRRGDTHDGASHGSARLSVPFDFLPVYGSRSNVGGAESETSKSWLFPFYSRSAERSADREVRRLSILWPLWNAEWEQDETRIRGLGGLSNFYERDSNGFVEQRLLYRLFTRRNRSWFHEHEFMPFFSRTVREDGSGSWDFLGGLLGAGQDASRRYLRLLYIPVTTGKSGAPAADESRAARDRHAGYALNYLKHNQYDRAAIEFTLAGDARANDLAFQLATAESYLNAEPDGIARELRSSIPPDLKFLADSGGARESGRVRRALRDAAIARFEAAVRLGADKPDTLVRIARAQCDLGEDEKALLTLEQSDALRPSFATAMDRVGVLFQLSDNKRAEENRIRRTALVEALLQRYPESPTLLLRLARIPGAGERNPARYDWGWAGGFGSDAFSAQADRALSLLRRGAVALPGAEEKAWLAAGAKAMRSDRHMPEPAPGCVCARTAIDILNARLSNHVTNKKIEAAEALLPDIRLLLPRACPACERAAGGAHESEARWDSSASRSAGSLYWIYVRERKAPLKFIATTKEWAAGLCAHQRKEFEKALESVRFEQQYLKDWRVTGMINGKAVNHRYHGDFFQRYVDLDAMLGKPDRCEVAAECVILSPDERPAVLRLGFDNRLAAELNGKTLFGPKARTIAVRDEYTVRITLAKGGNRLRLLVADDTLGYGFYARLSACSGELMEDVTVTPAP